MAKVILKTDIPREKGYLYFCSTSKDGMIEVSQAVMARGKKKKSK